MKNCRTNQEAAFTRKDLAAVIAILALLSIVCFPRAKRMYDANHQEACLYNLRFVDGAKLQWALELHKQNSDVPVALDLRPYLGRGDDGRDYREEGGIGLPYCPDDPLKKFTNSYTPNSVANAPNCKIVPTSHILP